MWILFGIIYLIIGVIILAVGIIVIKAIVEDEGYEMVITHLRPLKSIARILFWPAYLIWGFANSKKMTESGSITDYIVDNYDFTMVEEDP